MKLSDGGTRDVVSRTYSNDGSTSPACWSLRLAWHADGAGELYPYLPQVGTSSDTPFGRGLFTWKRGAWTHIAMRVRLNDIGVPNGEVEVYVDGLSAIKVVNLTLRTGVDDRVHGVLLQTFFGFEGEHHFAYM